MLKLLASLLLITPAVWASEIELSKRIFNHVTIGDHHTAVREACLALENHPDSFEIYGAALAALAAAHEENQLFALWRECQTKFPEEQYNRQLLELLAWNVLQEGANSSSPVLRLMAMLGAYFSNDAKGLPIVLKSLNDGNTYARSIAVRLASDMPDKKIRTAILQRFKQENAFAVRLALIEAVGKLKIKELHPELAALASNSTARDEERHIAVDALVAMTDPTDRLDIQAYAQDNRAGMRLLACQAAIHGDQTEDAQLLSPLIHDVHPDVRIAAMQAIGFLHPPFSEELEAHCMRALEHRDYKTAITAAWLLILYDQPKGSEAMLKRIQQTDRKVRLFAAGALCGTGSLGTVCMTEAFQQSNDPYVKLNLARGLIGQRILVEDACQALYDGLLHCREKWSWQEMGLFRSVVPNAIGYEDPALSPEEANQTTRLEIWNTLAMMRFPKAKEALQSYLKERTWGITGVASALLLTECDDSAVDIVQSLLADSNPRVRIQSALILALWGSGQETLTVLETAYEGAEKQLKERILEGIGKVGSPASIPFLAQKLQEPQLSLRIIAAFALLQCLHK